MEAKKKIQVLSTISLTDEQIQNIKRVSHQIHIEVFRSKDTSKIPDEVWRKAEVLLIGSRFLPPIEKVPELRWIQSSWAGVETFLDDPILQQKNIRLTSASGAMVSQLGEFAIMMMLMLGHKMPAMIKAQQEKRWVEDKFVSLQPRELRGSTVGIVGYGSIGREVARHLHQYGATVLACKRDVLHPEDKGYVPEGLGDPHGDYFERLYPIEGIEGMLKDCDFVLASLPATKNTEQIFTEKVFNAMEPGAYFVNISRGSLVDENALINALNSGQLGGAALDVFSEEPLPAESPLWNHPKIIITPHLAGYSPNMMNQVITLFIENLKRYVNQEELYNLIDLQQGY